MNLDLKELSDRLPKGVCSKKLHFPERIYMWDFGEFGKHLYGHCANCGTEYKIKKYYEIKE